jgi:hypothetical protein
MKTLKAVFFVIFAVLYLNIGYQYSNIGEELSTAKHADTFVENVISGGWNLLFCQMNGTFDSFSNIIIMLLWPILLGIALLTWIVFAFVQVIEFLWKFIFCGGLYGLVGTNGMIGGILILALSWVIYRIVVVQKKINKM